MGRFDFYPPPPPPLRFAAQARRHTIAKPALLVPELFLLFFVVVVVCFFGYFHDEVGWVGPKWPQTLNSWAPLYMPKWNVRRCDFLQYRTISQEIAFFFSFARTISKYIAQNGKKSLKIAKNRTAIFCDIVRNCSYKQKNKMRFFAISHDFRSYEQKKCKFFAKHAKHGSRRRRKKFLTFFAEGEKNNF